MIDKTELRERYTAQKRKMRPIAALIMALSLIIGALNGLLAHWLLGFVMDTGENTRIPAALTGVAVVLAYGQFRALSGVLALKMIFRGDINELSGK